MSKLLSKLNAKQRQAASHGDGPLLLLAGAGSGKTRTMTYRIAHLISERNVSPRSILGLSFTNKAAKELKERVIGLLKKSNIKIRKGDLIISTFHALCVRILRAHGDVIGYSKDFTICDQGDQVEMIRQILRRIKIDDRKFDPMSILFQIGQSKNQFLSPEQAQEFLLNEKKTGFTSDYSIVAASCYEHYQEGLKSLNAMDFDDLLFNTVKLLEESDDVREKLNKRFKFILVDEYQDTNPAQFRLLRLLTESRQNINVVGDDDQSIYGWRGADSTHILEFSRQFQDSTMITLDQNYRSTNMILESANQVIAKNSKRHPKKLWSDRGEGTPIHMRIYEDDPDEARSVCEEILEIQKNNERRWDDFAILFRSNRQARIFEENLRFHMIPYKLMGAYSFLNRKEIKDALAYWRVIINPSDDVSVRRVINWPPRGIGKTTLKKLGDIALQQEISMMEAISRFGDASPKAKKGLDDFQSKVSQLRSELHEIEPTPMALSLWAARSLSVLGVRAGIESDHDDQAQATIRWEIVEELANSIGRMNFEDMGKKPTDGVGALRNFITHLMLEAQEEEDDKDSKDNENKVSLLTLHASKGLEFPVVFLVGMEDGFLPHQRTIDDMGDLSEERRLCYVGMTRAKDLLYLTRARHRIRYGKPVPRNPSRFLEDVPSDRLIVQDCSSTPDLTSQEAVEKHEAKVSDFLSQIRNRISDQN